MLFVAVVLHIQLSKTSKFHYTYHKLDNQVDRQTYGKTSKLFTSSSCRLLSVHLFQAKKHRKRNQRTRAIAPSRPQSSDETQVKWSVMLKQAMMMRSARKAFLHSRCQITCIGNWNYYM